MSIVGGQNVINNGSEPHTARRIVATYDYRDEAGNVLYQSVRYKPKDFRQRVPKGDSWDWSLNGTRRVLYRLPELIASQDIVWIPEGEKDVDRLIALGLTATCNAMGAGKWRPEYSESLRGRHIILIPDNDDPGRNHAQTVFDALRGIAASATILSLAGLPLKGDVSDWLDAGGTKDELLALAQTAVAAEEAKNAGYRPQGEQADPHSDGWEPPQDGEQDYCDSQPHDGRDDTHRPDQTPSAFVPIDAFELMEQFPTLLPTIIDDLLREAEILNLIAATKIGKSWTTIFLAFAVAFGLQWLGFQTTKGKVLLIDNELHKPTISYRLRRVAEALQIDPRSIKGRIEVISLRGNLQNILHIGDYLMSLVPRSFNLVIIDAQYRTLPADVDENSNGQQALFYNHLDRYADHLKAGFVLVHHSSKGDQSGKAVTDVGSGAGSMSRAADTHCILRPHEDENVVVLDAVARSFPPIAPRCLRWAFPLFSIDPDADPTALRVGRSRKSGTDDAAKEEATRVQNSADEMAVASCLDRLTAAGDAATLTRIRVGSGLSRDRTDKALERLRQAKVIEEFDTMTRGGRGAQQSVMAYRRKGDL